MAKDITEKASLQGGQILKLTVGDWDALGETLARFFEFEKVDNKGVRGKIANMAGSFATTLTLSARQRIKAASELQPYDITRRTNHPRLPGA